MSQNPRIVRVLLNSRFGVHVLVSDSNILQIISIVRKVLYSKTPLFSGTAFLPYFQNPSENSAIGTGDRSVTRLISTVSCPGSKPSKKISLPPAIYSPALKKWGLHWCCLVLPSFCDSVIRNRSDENFRHTFLRN